MVNGYYTDPHTNIVKERFAIVYAPKRQRGRFPENCVEVVGSEEDACNSADRDAKRFPAVVLGPARSSEGFQLYYLVRWLEVSA